MRLDHVLRSPAGGLRLVSTDPDISKCVLTRFGNRVDEVSSSTGTLELIGARIPGATWDPDFCGRLDGDVIEVDLTGAKGRFDLSTMTGRVEISTDFPRIDHYIENVLRMVVADRAERTGKFLCHAAALSRSRDYAALFVGPSGAGKSTMTELGLQHGWFALSDDMCVLDPVERTVAGASFHSNARLEPFDPGTRRLRAIFELVQDDEDRATRLPRARAAAVLASALVTWRPRTREENDSILGNAVAVCTDIAAYELRFRQTPDIWSVVERELHGL